jgi:flagellar basal body-associated protein FliL
MSTVLVLAAAALGIYFYRKNSEGFEDHKEAQAKQPIKEGFEGGPPGWLWILLVVVVMLVVVGLAIAWPSSESSSNNSANTNTNASSVTANSRGLNNINVSNLGNRGLVGGLRRRR